MLSTIRNRMILIGLLILASIIYLIPRNVTVRQRDAQGGLHDVQHRQVPIKYGLDLQGGMHLSLGLDTTVKKVSDPANAIDLALIVLRKRIDDFGVAEPLIQKLGNDQIVVELPGLTEPDRAIGIVQSQAFLEFRLTDKTGALDAALPQMDRALTRLGIKGTGPAPKASGVAALLGSDTSKKGTLKSDSGKKTHADSVASDTTTAQAILSSLIHPASDIGVQALPGEYAVLETAYNRVDTLLNIPDVKRLWPRGVEFKWSQDPISVGTQSYRMLYALSDKAIVDGSHLTHAAAQIDPLTQKRVVTFTLDRSGGRIFGAETGRHVGDYMAIVLNNKVQGPPPVIESQINQNGQIELGNRSLADAQDLALTLSAGALPVPLKVLDERQVGASLGADSIHDGMVAGLVGTLMVIIIMVGYYRWSGVLAVAALGLYVLFTLAGLAAVQATLTLPGLAGLVLSVGIAVDANVLIFERIREELIAGRSVRVAVDEGFKHAMNAIVDSNVSTVVTALFLFQFGTGPVKGFAVTLIMGIAASMVTAVFVTKTFFLLWLQRRPTATTLSI
ncbi:MAG TPA: protein translocase subunit SecD [Gemmatimonadales bacterium]|jgi:preprotein translocase subunit SecD